MLDRKYKQIVAIRATHKHRTEILLSPDWQASRGGTSEVSFGHKTPKYAVLESWCFETQEDGKSSKEKPHQTICKYNLVAPILLCLVFPNEWNSDGKKRFPLWKGNGKSLGEAWYPAFLPTPVQTAFCSHCSFTLRSGGKRPEETSMAQVGLPWHHSKKETAKWSSVEMDSLVP